MTTTLSGTEAWSLLSLSLACLAILAQTLHGDGAPLNVSIAFSGLAFALTYALIRWLGDSFIRAGLKGKDMSKMRKVEMLVGAPVFHLSSEITMPEASARNLSEEE